MAATVIGMLGRYPEADDVGQEVFVRFYRALPRFRGDSSLGTYLTRIAINLSLNELKRRKRRRLLFGRSDDDFPEPSHNPEQEAGARRQRQELVERALARLDPKFRAVVVLRLLEGYSTEETAEILQIPLGTALSRLARAQRKLQELLRPYIDEEL